MSLLTEQEMRSIMRSVKEIGENSDRALILATEASVIEKIKAQGAAAWTDIKTGVVFVALNDSVTKCSAYMALRPLYHLPEGD